MFVVQIRTKVTSPFNKYWQFETEKEASLSEVAYFSQLAPLICVGSK